MRSDTYREIAKDGGATGQALLVVALVATAGVVGEWLDREGVEMALALVFGLIDGVLS